MDYALLAATALGAIGLYLMLPRERAPLVRLGGLLGALAFAGLCLFLVRVANQGLGGSTERPPVYFYLFAGIMIGGAVGVVCQPRPVYAALYFVLVTLAGAGMFVLLQAEFMAVVLIIIYAGAILVTYVFVIMLASQGSTGGNVVAPAYDRHAAGGCVAVAVAFILVGSVLQVLLPSNPAKGGIAEQHKDTANSLMERNLEVNGAKGPPVSNVQLLGSNLYSQYSLSLELAGILLTIALVGAVVIARKNTPERQELGAGGIPTE
ncbi:MAG TPA: NADH-quinone oxidoreductase subunit J [Phycisphaerae bacterium]|nr:NADH-quinone oxidoreductase subunit J [Phycisphaerae bacterium]